MHRSTNQPIYYYAGNFDLYNKETTAGHQASVKRLV